MIHPFWPTRLRPASYQLTLGDEVNIGGEHKRLDYQEEIVLEPHQVAVVCTHETLRIPRDIIARWSLRVTNIYEGLLWTGGPQVDPGWEGQLFCPIYNLAERSVVLKSGAPLFTIDFVRTTGLTDELWELKRDPKYKRVWFKPVRSTLQEHDRHRLHSAPYEALRELRELRHFRNVGYAAITLMLLVLTLVVGALAVMSVQQPVELKYPWTDFALLCVVFVSISSIIISIYLLFRLRKLL